MQLQPKCPPGRADRKAAAYADQIVRLRAEGYTFEAIRQALAEVGIAVSHSALRREVRRARSPVARQTAARPVLTQQSPAPSSAPSSARSPAGPTSGRATGRDIAEAFFKAHPSNPLLPNKETP